MKLLTEQTKADYAIGATIRGRGLQEPAHVEKLVIEGPRLGEGPNPSITTVIREASWADWSPCPFESLPVAAGSVRYLAGGFALHTDVADEGLVEVALGAGKTYRLVMPLLAQYPAQGVQEPRWTMFPAVWAGVVDALRSALGAAIERTKPGASPAFVRECASECKELSGLTDAQLAALFPGEVARETFNRWLNGTEKRPLPANLRRLGFLRGLFAEVAGRVELPRNWLLAPVAGQAESPYELLKSGRWDEVEDLLWTLPEPGEKRPGPVLRSPGGPLASDTEVEGGAAADFDSESTEWTEVEVEEGDED